MAKTKESKPTVSTQPTVQASVTKKSAKSAKATEAVAEVAPTVVAKVTKKSAKATEPVTEAAKVTKKSAKATEEVTAPVKAVKKIAKAVEVVQPAHEEEQVGKRYFKCIIVDGDEVKVSGRYSGKKPKQAASKACTKLYEDLRSAGQAPTEIVFGMHECTRANKKKKKYFYIGKREKLDKPEQVSINKIDPKTNKQMVITYHYNNDVKKLHDIEAHPEYVRLSTYDAREEQAGGNARVAKKAKGKKSSARSKSKKVARVQRKASKVESAPVAEVTQVSAPVKVKKTVKKTVKTSKATTN